MFTIAVAGGKGGVGKSMLSANLGLSLAQVCEQEGGWVLAVDLDVGCGNLNWCLGVTDAPQNINHFLLGEVKQLGELLRETEQPRLSMICSSYTGVPPARLDADNRARLMHQLPRLGPDYVILDLGAGTSQEVLEMFLGGDEKIIVVNPDPLSLQNAFIFLKSTLVHFLTQELEKEEFLSPLKKHFHRLVEEQENLNIRDLLSRLQKWDQYSAYVLAGLVDDLRVRFVVNMYRPDETEKTYLREFHHVLFTDLCLRNNISYLGFVHWDNGFQKSVQSGQPFLIQFPESQAAADIVSLAQRLISGEQLDNIPALHFPEDPVSSWRPFWRR